MVTMCLPGACAWLTIAAPEKLNIRRKLPKKHLGLCQTLLRVVQVGIWSNYVRDI